MLPSRPPFPSGVMDLILPRDERYGALFLSGVEAALNPFLLAQNQIGAVLTVGTEMQSLQFEAEQKVLLPSTQVLLLHDTHHDPIKKHFEEAIDFIHQKRSANLNVLVHCYVGVSRSATIVIAYLMHSYHYPLHQALSFLLQRRPLINPNPGFLQQLQSYDQELLRKRLPKHRPASTDLQTHHNHNHNHHHHHHHQSDVREFRPLQSHTPLKKVAQLHNSVGRHSLMMTPSSVRTEQHALRALTPSQNRMSLTQDSFRQQESTRGVLRQSNLQPQFYSAKKPDSQQSHVHKAASVFCRSYANTPQVNPIQVLLKSAAGSGLGHAKRGRLPVRVTQQQH